MFESAGAEGLLSGVSDAVLEAWAPVDEAPQCEGPDFDAWIEQLAARGPGRPRPPGEVIAAGERACVDPDLLAQVTSVDLDGLDDEQLIGLVVALSRAENHLAALKLAAIARFAGPAPTSEFSDEAFAWSEVAAALRVGDGTGRRLVDLARRLRDDLPGTLAAMRSGDVSEYKASILADATLGMSAEACRRVEERVLPRAAARTPHQHSAATARAVAAVDPEALARRRRRARQDITLIRVHHGDATGELLARMPSEQLDAVWTAADTWARSAKAAGDARGLDQLRVAALVDWASRYLTGAPITDDTDDTDDTDGDQAGSASTGATPQRPTAPGLAPPSPVGLSPSAPTRHGLPVTVNICLTLPAALGVCDDPAELVESGALVPAEVVRDMLRGGAKIRWLLLDPRTGALRGISARRHDPPPLMRAFLHARDVTATTPTGSRAPAAAQDHDHIDPHGPTTPANLHSPTRSWHRAKTFGHWMVTVTDDGCWTWTSRRTRRSYIARARDHRVGRSEGCSEQRSGAEAR